MVSEAGDWVGQGTDRLFDVPGTVSVSGGSSSVTVHVDSGPEWFNFEFAAPSGRQLEAGEYTDANRGASKAWPGLSVGGDGRGCNTSRGRFIVKDIHVGSSGTVERFWALYEQHCEGPEEPALFGEVRVGEPATETSVDTVPAAVSWPLTPVGKRSVYVPVTLSAGEAGATIASVMLTGEDAGDFTIAGNDCDGDVLQPRATCELEVAAAPSGPGVRTAEVTITDQSGAKTVVPLVVATEAPPPPPMSSNSATLVSEAGDWIGLGVNRLLDEPESVSISGERSAVQVRAEAAGESFSFSFAAPDGQQLAVGEYVGTSSSAGRGWPGLDVSGSGRGCGTSTGSFIVKDIHFNGSGEIERFWALYEQHCENADAPAAFGEVRFGEPAAEAPEVVAPSAVAWPQTAVGRTGVEVPVTVGAGEGGAHVASVVLEGEDAGDFTIANDECAGTILARRARCELAVAVTPKAPGLRTAQLVITDQSGAKTAVALRVDTEPPLPPPMSNDTATLVSEPGDWIGEGTDRLFDGPEAVTVKGSHSFIEVQAAFGSEWFTFEFAAPYHKELEVGEYTRAKRYPFQKHAPGLTVGGDGHGCNTSLGRFTIKDIHFGPSGTVDRFWALYEQHCEGPHRPPSFGEVRVGEPATTAPEVVAPSDIEWPLTVVGRPTIDVPVTVGAGEGGASIASVKLEGEDAGDFAIANDECYGVTLAPRARCELAVSAKPRAAGHRSAQLVITDTSGAQTTIPLAVHAKH
jgi:hypothetical protein